MNLTRQTFVLLKRYWKPLFILNGLLVVGAITSYTLSPRVWVADAQLIMPNTGGNLDINLGTLGTLSNSSMGFSNELNPLKIQISILTSRNVLEKVLEADPERQKFTVLSSFQKLFSIKPQDQSTNIRIEVKGSSPEVAKLRAKNLLHIYQQRLNQLRRDADANRDTFQQSQLRNAEAALLRAQNSLASYQKSTGLINPAEQTKSLVSLIDGLTSTQVQISAQRKALASQMAQLSRQLEMSPKTALDSLRLSENKEYQMIRIKLSELNAELANARGIYPESSPMVQNLVDSQEQLRQVLNQKLQSLVGNQRINNQLGGNSFKDSQADLIVKLIQAEAEVQGLGQQSNQLQLRINQLNQRLAAYSTQQTRLMELQRNYNIAEGTYKGIVAQVEKSKVSAFDYYPNVQVLDLPNADIKPISPRGSLVALGGILSALLGSAALVLCLDARNPRLRPKDMEEIDLPLLGHIPKLAQLLPEYATANAQTRRQLSYQGRKQFNQPINEQLCEQVSVEFQRMASAISLMDLPKQRLMISSSQAGEGKTSVTLGVGIALAEMGFRVLLVDGDFHQGGLSQRLGYPPSSLGLKEWLTPVTVGPRLDLLPALSRNDATATIEWLVQGRFEQTLTDIQHRHAYDYLLVDSSPAHLTSEALLMAKVIVNILAVVRMEVSKLSAVQDMLAQFSRHQGQVIGLVLNGMDTSADMTNFHHIHRYPQLTAAKPTSCSEVSS